MPRISAKRFTDRWVETIKPDTVHREYGDAAAPGLILRVASSGRKDWRLTYTFDGKRQRPTIGTYPRMSLGDAREFRDDVLKAAKRGIDLLASVSRESRAVYAFDKVAEQFIAAHVRRKSKDPDNAIGILRREFVAVWGTRDIRQIKRADVHAVLDAIVERGHPIAANRALSRISKLFRWAVSREIVETSPCFAIEKPSPEQSSDRVLTADELVKLWQAADRLGYPYGNWFKLLALTVQRRSFVAGIRWDALDGDLWSFANKDTSGAGNNILVLPLPRLAMNVIRSCPRTTSAFVFPSSRLVTHFTTYGDAKEELDRASGVTGWTFHDLRRTVSTHMIPLGVGEVVVERILHHRLPRTLSAVAPSTIAIAMLGRCGLP